MNEPWYWLTANGQRAMRGRPGCVDALTNDRMCPGCWWCCGPRTDYHVWVRGAHPMPLVYDDNGITVERMR